MRFGLKDGVNSASSNLQFGPSYSPQMVTAVATASAAVARLDARISGSPVASAWIRQISWAGYAKALQLQSAEIEEIDLFSWACGFQIAGRPLRATTVDLFDRFASWTAGIGNGDALAWQDALPTAIGEPAHGRDHPPLIRALESVRQHARLDGSIEPWLALPFALRDKRAAARALPCLTGGAKAFRMKRTPNEGDWLAAIRGVEGNAFTGLERLDQLERTYRDAQRAIVAEFRAGALPRLLALTFHRPLVSPQSVSDQLGLSVAGASKLLDRAVAAGFLVEISRRRTWRQFLTTDLAIAFGFAPARRGRPTSEPPPLPANRDIADVFDRFDRELADIDALLARSGA